MLSGIDGVLLVVVIGEGKLSSPSTLRSVVPTLQALVPARQTALGPGHAGWAWQRSASAAWLSSSDSRGR